MLNLTSMSSICYCFACLVFKASRSVFASCLITYEKKKTLWIRLTYLVCVIEAFWIAVSGNQVFISNFKRGGSHKTVNRQTESIGISSPELKISFISALWGKNVVHMNFTDMVKKNTPKKPLTKQIIVMHNKVSSPVDVHIDSIFERKGEADGVVMEIFPPLIVITAEKINFTYFYSLMVWFKV